MFQNSSQHKVDLLAIGVHPDDIELCCSGTLLKHIKMGYSIGLLDLTKGELGTRGNPQLRSEEAFKAATLMRATFRTQLDLQDGFFTNNEESILKICKIIRDSRPKIVLANALHDRHPDHGRAGKLIQDACFYSSLAKVKTLDDAGSFQERWKPDLVLHYIQDYHLIPDIVVDISEQMDKKLELISCFASQFYNPDSLDLESAISGADFKDYIRSKSKIFGRPIFVEYAEGFQTARPIGVNNLLNLI